MLRNQSQRNSGDPADLPSGRELDVAIAEQVFGYQHLIGAAVPEMDRHREEPVAQQEVWIRGTDRYCRWCGDMPQYSTDIAAAWQVVEHFTALSHVRCNLKWDREVDPEHPSWGCEFLGPWYAIHHWGETAPLAICRAALEFAEHNAGASPAPDA